MSARGEVLEAAAPAGGTVRCELFAAAGAGPHPGVVVLHESFGLNDDIRRIAGRFAEAGYTALAPDLYSHGRRIVCLSRVIVDMVRGAVAREVGDIHAAREALAAGPRSTARASPSPASARAVASRSSPAAARGSPRPPSTTGWSPRIAPSSTACALSWRATEPGTASSGAIWPNA
jgi:dienelactone hydrolase